MKRFLPVALLGLFGFLLWFVIDQVNDAADLFEETFDVYDDDIEEDSTLF